MINTNLKEFLTRYSKGMIDEVPESVNTHEISSLINSVNEYRHKLKRTDVSAIMVREYPDYFNMVIEDSLDNESILHILDNNYHKQMLMELDVELTENLDRNYNNPSFDWVSYKDKLANIILRKNESNSFLSLNNFKLDKENKIVASWGIPLLDYYLGGIAKASLNVVFGGVNSGKSTFSIAYMASSLIKQGKKPLIVFLEGSQEDLILDILKFLKGWGLKSNEDLTDSEIKELESLSEKLPDVPIIDKKANKRWQLESYIRKYKPDVILYDQLTLGESRTWESITNTISVLKLISRESKIPVLAVTQSDERAKDLKNLGGDDDHVIGDVKYAQAIKEDATHMLHIGANASLSKRYLTIIKTKNRKTSQLGQVKLEFVMTNNGFDILGRKEGFELIPTKEILNNVENKKDDFNVENNQICEVRGHIQSCDGVIESKISEQENEKETESENTRDDNEKFGDKDIEEYTENRNVRTEKSNRILKTELGKIEIRNIVNQSENITHFGVKDRLKNVSEDLDDEFLDLLSKVQDKYNKNSFIDENNKDTYLLQEHERLNEFDFYKELY